MEGHTPRLTGAARLLAVLALLARLAAPAGAQPEADAQALVQRAREAAAEDRNREAADLFERAVRADPSLRRELLRELADQLTYSGRAARAVPLYREVLGFEPDSQARRWTRLRLALALSWTQRLREAQHEYEALAAENPDDLDARLGRARVLAWRDRLQAARDEYAAILHDNPHAVEAQRELARMQWWRQRPRDAQRRLRELLSRHPNDADTRLLLAEVQRSLGRPDQARATLRVLLEQDPEHAGARALYDEITRTHRAARVQQYASRQSDGLDIRVTAVEQRVPAGGGRTVAELRYEWHGYDPEGAGGGVRLHRPGLFARHRLNDDAEVNAYAHLDLVRAAGVPERTRATYDAWATWWPADVLRLDLSARRALFDNVRSLRMGLWGTYAGLSADFTPTEKTRLTARGSLGRVSDGNARRWGQLEGEHRVWNHPRTLLGARVTAIDFRATTLHGYFEPQDFRSAVATARAWDAVGGRLWWDVEGSYGREYARDQAPKPVWSAGARAVYRAGRRTEVEVRYQYFSSLADASGGFARGAVSAAVRHAW